jgi:hypothetical protein
MSNPSTPDSPEKIRFDLRHSGQSGSLGALNEIKALLLRHISELESALFRVNELELLGVSLH